MKFSIKDSSVNVTKSSGNMQETADLVKFTEEILNGKLHFLCSVLFNKSKSLGSLPLVLPHLFINYPEIKRENSLKFLGVMIDENLTWKTNFEKF